MRSDQTGEDAGSAPRVLPSAAGPCAPSARERLVLVLGWLSPRPRVPSVLFLELRISVGPKLLRFAVHVFASLLCV